jgi:hypothetical protein
VVEGLSVREIVDPDGPTIRRRRVSRARTRLEQAGYRETGVVVLVDDVDVDSAAGRDRIKALTEAGDATRGR